MTEKIEPLRMQKTDTYQSLRGKAAPFGPELIETPRGPVMVFDAPGILVANLMRDDPEESRVAVILYGDGSPSVPGRGLICQLSPEAARSIADSLRRTADRIKPEAAN